MIVMFSDSMLMPNVKGGPKNCMACNETSVKTRTCCLVSTAQTISEPEPMRRSPAVLSGNDCHVVGDSCPLKRINKGSCTPMLFSGSHPKAMMCLSLSETRTCFATVGMVGSVPNEDKVTAGAEKPDVLSQ